jgi:hypothetical protein
MEVGGGVSGVQEGGGSRVGYVKGYVLCLESEEDRMITWHSQKVPQWTKGTPLLRAGQPCEL